MSKQDISAYKETLDASVFKRLRIALQYPRRALKSVYCETGSLRLAHNLLTRMIEATPEEKRDLCNKSGLSVAELRQLCALQELRVEQASKFDYGTLCDKRGERIAFMRRVRDYNLLGSHKEASNLVDRKMSKEMND